MIPMRIKVPNEQSVIIKKIFQASEIAPLAIQMDENDENKRTFKVLFKLNEHITNTDIFFEIRLLCDDDLDVSYIKSRSLYIKNIEKDENKYKAFKNIMKDFSIESFYVGDFNYELENGNYYIDGLKQLLDPVSQNIFFETIRIYIPRYMLIAISLYIEDLLDPYNKTEKEYLFASNDIANMRFDKAENLKILGTCKTKNGEYFSYNTMYELSTGPTSWKFTYEIITIEDLQPKEIVEENNFKTWYSQYAGNYIGLVREPNNLYCFVVVKNDKGKVVSLVTHGDLINKTNLIDPYKIFIEEETDESEEDEDSVSDVIENISVDEANSWNNENNKEEEVL